MKQVLGKGRRWAAGGAILIWLGTLTACEGSFLKKKIDELKGKKTETAPVPPSPPVQMFPPKVPPAVPPPPVLPPPTTSAPETLPSTTTLTPPAAPSLDEKIAETNLYVECLNRTVPRTSDSQRRYLSWVNERTGPTCKETYISYGLYTLYEDGIKKCRDAAQQGAASGPSWPKIEKAMGDLSAAYAELVPLAQQAEDYYQQQDYKDDNCAKGQALHPKLMDAFRRFRQAKADMDPELQAIKAELDIAELARVEQTSGKKLEWHVRALNLAARQLITTVPEDTQVVFQAGSYLALYPKLDESYNALNAYVAANPAEIEGVFWFSAFQSSAKDFYTKAKFLKRDLAEGKKADARALQDFLDQYNRFVGDSNNLRFRS
jgi:hypothetical protein